jgi:hypothetical protein
MNRSFTAQRRVRSQPSYRSDEREMRQNYDYSGYGARAPESARETFEAPRGTGEDRRPHGPPRSASPDFDAYERERYIPGGRFEQNPWAVPRGDRPYAHDLRDERSWSPQLRSHAGRGPRGYVRPDPRIHEDVSDRLYLDQELDAREIEVLVRDGCVILEGRVDSPRARRIADDIAHAVPGVWQVYNHLQVSGHRR